MSNFAWWYYTVSITCSLNFQWPWHYFKVTAVSNSFNWNFYVLVQLSWSSEIVKYIQAGHEYTTIFDLCTYSREVIDVFPDLTTTFSLAFSWTLSEVFQLLHYFNFAWGLPIHLRFDDFDLVSRSQVCQNHKLQIVFLILVHCSLNVVWCLHTLKDQAHCALCDLRDN